MFWNRAMPPARRRRGIPAKSADGSYPYDHGYVKPVQSPHQDDFHLGE